MSVVSELAAAIAADPHDVAPQLVIADYLLSIDDPRGELIVLDHRDRTSPRGLDDREALERILLLAAEYTFPDPRDAVDPVLPFTYARGVASVLHQGRTITIRYRRRRLRVVIDDGPPALHVKLRGMQAGGDWTDDERDTILTLLSDALRARAPLDELRFPYGDLVLPTYDGGPRRGYALPLEFLGPRRIAHDRYGLAARDYHRWHGLWMRLRALT